MSKTIHLINEYPGILDLSSINDVEGKRVVLQPKGMAGAERECFAEIEKHPHVTVFKNGGRLSIRRQAIPALEASAPPPPVLAIIETTPAPEPLPPAPESAPELPVDAAANETPVSPSESDDPPKSVEDAPPAPPSRRRR